MTVFSIVLQSLLVLYYAFSGGAKIAGVNYWTDMFRNLGLPQWFRVVTGVVQLAGVALLVAGYWYVESVAWAGIWLGVTMIAACLAHFRVKDPIGKSAAALVFTALLITLAVIHADALTF